MADQFTWRLSLEQRERLRRSVELSALEQLLARLPATDRALVLLGCYGESTASEALDALRAAGAGEAELEEVRPFAEYQPLPPHLAHPENDPDTTWVAPTWTVLLSVGP